ncbi:hypothetical protein DBR12_02345 [Acidovorax sp. HMWF029]|uniref:hypothetical protein n=1 Tax=Acidovorax sp. HMWF029 TaxID=2056863 RepID=UPI000D3B0348|nr:hypothetical protein [Acidovorax sp. HMWF029]PTT23134.1 hypothetical protein DBR12_02345 [Acidovorax sp. HMWF029]
MFSFLNRKPKPDKRDLEQVIFDYAEHKRNEDLQLICRLMVAREVFVPIDRGSMPAAAQPGVPYVLGDEDRVLMRKVTIPNNGEWASAATQPTHALLSNGYAGMTWIGFLKMTQKVAEIRGALLQGTQSWIAMDKKLVANVLSTIEDREGARDV